MIDLVSIDIPKTTGAVFRHTLQDIYGEDKVLLDYHQNYSPKSDFTKARVIHGHFKVAKYKDYFPEAKRIVWLRHPLFRLLSEYFDNYLPKERRPKMNPKLLEKDLNLLEFAAFPGKSNCITKQLSGMKLEEFDFVGIQEFYAEDIQKLIQLMGWPKIQLKTKNTNPYLQYFQQLQTTLADEKLVKQLIELNSDDVSLYHHALELRAKRQQQSVLLQYTLAENWRSLFWLEPMQQQVRRLSQQVKQIKAQRQSLKAMKLLRANLLELQDYLIGFWIAIPQVNQTQAEAKSTANTITIQGWVIGKNSAATEVIFCSDTEIIARTSVDQTRKDVAQKYPQVSKATTSGFIAEIPIAAVAKISKIDIFSVLEDQSKIQIGQIQSLG